MTLPMTCDIETAAMRLGGPFTVDWLRGHMHEIPHVKNGSGRGRGGRIGFTEAHLAEIVERFTVRPAEVPQVDPDDWGVRSRGTRARSA